MNKHINQPEDNLKRRVTKALATDFIILEEVPGASLVDQTNVRIDFLLYPKDYLIAEGFTQNWFGIEVKYIKGFWTGDTGKKAQLFWQAITYAQSIFKTPQSEFQES